MLERRLRKEVWAPAWIAIEQTVGLQFLEQVRTRLGHTFDPIRGELQVAQRSLLMSTGQGSGLAIDAYALALLDYFTRLGVLKLSAWEHWRRTALSGLWCLFLQGGFAAAVAPPSSIHLLQGTQRGARLHSVNGPALAWTDGTDLYRVRGAPVSELFFLDPDRVPLREILNARGYRLKQALINLLGLPRFMAMTKTSVIDQDVDRAGMPRRLLSLKVGLWADERWCVVEVRCPSKGDLHYLWVPPDMERCSQAVAWTFGFDIDTYLPVLEA